ncbi:MAG: ribonuclease R, partial [Candidatus Zixiibacteriota bacterium]
MAITPESILSFVSSKADRPMRIKELAAALKVKQADYTRFRRKIKLLLDSGELIRLKRGRIGLPDQLGVAVGKLTITRGGTGFLIREDCPEDILIPSTDLHTAFDGDKVMIRFRGHVQGREAGTVIKVLERARRNIVGVYQEGGHFSTVVPDNPRIHKNIYIPPELSLDAQYGEKVVVELVEWDDPFRNPEGKVIERLGRPNDPGVDMLSIIKGFGLPLEFPAEILDQAERAAAMSYDDIPRMDITRDCVYTIDPADAKDHDDAVSVDETPKGFRLGVHIADVSYYVRPGSALDTEAFERGNSVYLPGSVIPMIPEVLSNDVCSLRPNRRRPAHSVFIDFDRKGKMLKWELADTVVKSRAKLSYEEVQDFFDSGVVNNKLK